MKIIKRITGSVCVRFVKDICIAFFNWQVMRTAAALAYFLIMTIFPFIICLSDLLQGMPLDFARIFNLLSDIIPDSVVTLIQDYLQYINKETDGIMVTGWIVMLISASAAIRTVLNFMKDIYQRGRYGLFLQVVFSFVYSVIFLIAVYFSIFLVVMGNDTVSAIRAFFHLHPAVDRWLWIRYPIFFLFLFFIVYGLYRFAVPRQKPRLSVWQGAMFTSCTLAIISTFFPKMVETSGRYSLIYGSLASVIILLLWLYLCCNVIILGAVVNAVLDQYKNKGEIT